MGWGNSQFDGTLVIPTDATTGPRIVLDGTTGVITVYDAANFAVATISPADGFLTQSATGEVGQVDQGVVRVGSSDWDNTASLSAQPSIANGGLSTFLGSATDTLGPGNAQVGLTLDPGDASGFPYATAEFSTPGNTTPILFVLDGVDQGRGLLDHTARTTNTAGVTGTETIALTSASVTFLAGRAYRVTIKGVVQSSTAGDTVQLRVRKTNAVGAIYLDTFTALRVNVAGDNSLYTYENVIRNDTGADVTAALVMTYVRGSGAGTVLVAADAVNPAYIEINDVGASGSYPSANEIA